MFSLSEQTSNISLEALSVFRGIEYSFDGDILKHAQLFDLLIAKIQSIT